VVRDDGAGLTTGRIVETEAYGGPEDRASHSRAGLTRRTAPMHGPVGHAYVYLVYGMHYCLNVVARADGAPAGAVLLRALELPDAGDARLAAGPAKLTKAMSIDLRLNGHDLTTGPDLWLAAGGLKSGESVAVGPRVGVAYAGEGWADRPWRFWLAANRSVSR
jgi:DNA-3-methyladenine glycosylase